MHDDTTLNPDASPKEVVPRVGAVPVSLGSVRGLIHRAPEKVSVLGNRASGIRHSRKLGHKARAGGATPRPFIFVSYVLRADYVLRARGLELRLRGGASGMSEIQMGLILLGIIVVLTLILIV